MSKNLTDNQTALGMICAFLFAIGFVAMQLAQCQIQVEKEVTKRVLIEKAKSCDEQLPTP